MLLLSLWKSRACVCAGVRIAMPADTTGLPQGFIQDFTLGGGGDTLFPENV